MALTLVTSPRFEFRLVLTIGLYWVLGIKQDEWSEARARNRAWQLPTRRSEEQMTDRRTYLRASERVRF